MNDPTAELALIRRREFITRWRERQAACGGGGAGAGEAEKAAAPETPAEMLDRLKAGAASPMRLSDAALATVAVGVARVNSFICCCCRCCSVLTLLMLLSMDCNMVMMVLSWGAAAASVRVLRVAKLAVWMVACEDA